MLLYWLILPVVIATEILQGPLPRKSHCSVLTTARTDCGRMGTSQYECEANGCCWNPITDGRWDVPWCFHPQVPARFYHITRRQQQENGDQHLDLVHQNPTLDQAASKRLTVTVRHLGSDIVHVHISDPDEARPQVPAYFYETIEGYEMPQHGSSRHEHRSLHFQAMEKGPFNFIIERVHQGRGGSQEGSSRELLFDTHARNEDDLFDSLIFKKHYMSFGTRLPKNHYIYGLGERATSFRKRPGRLAMNARDISAFEDENSYGSHPFYMEMRPNGMAHGVFVKNSHPMEVELTSDSLVYHLLGGTIDLYFFAGPTPDQVIEQYTRLIGRPPLLEPKFFGYHQCRYGYRTLEHWKEVVENFERNELPLDGIWFDIDYMWLNKIFTLDPQRYPPDQVASFIQEQHMKGRFVVVIIDPGVAIDPKLPAYTDALHAKIFLHSSNDNLYEGFAWPGNVHFLDFLNPHAVDYWTKMIGDFKKLVDFSGLWLDMCEPANLDEKYARRIPEPPRHGHYSLNYPPYAINNANRGISIFSRTIDMDAKHYRGMQHYAVHNIYGLSETYCTIKALNRLMPTKRHFLLTRSTFPGSGRFTAHWLGDNFSTFRDLALSISGMLDFQLFGIPMVGADICGFLGATDEELCARWMALGAFYPFSRNHNAENERIPPQEPYRWPRVLRATKKYFALRYALLPYWYTLSYWAHKSGRAIIRPLFFEYPHEEALYAQDLQFLVGAGLMVVPVTERSAQGVEFWLPAGIWYDALDVEALPLRTDSLRREYAAVDEISIPVFRRGGHVILQQAPGLTIPETLTKDYELIVALNTDLKAKGTFYFDDLVSLKVEEKYSLIDFVAECHETMSVSCKMHINGHFKYAIERRIEKIQIWAPFQWSLSQTKRAQLELDGHLIEAQFHPRGFNLAITLPNHVQLEGPHTLELTFAKV